MPPSSPQPRQRTGTLLVILQFGLLSGLAALAFVRFSPGTMSLGAWLLAAACVMLAAWTLIHNRPGNFNIHPAPKVLGSLVTTGPYRWIRHPMYTAVLLGAGALAWVASVGIAWAAWFALALVLILKSTLEERWMCEQHPDYGAYKQTSKRFLPWLF